MLKEDEICEQTEGDVQMSGEQKDHRREKEIYRKTAERNKS